MDLQLLLNPKQHQLAQTYGRSSQVSFIQESPTFLTPTTHSQLTSPSPSRFSKSITEFTYNDLNYYNYSQSSASSSSSSISNSSSLLSLSTNNDKKYPSSSSIPSVCSNKDTSIISSIGCQTTSVDKVTRSVDSVNPSYNTVEPVNNVRKVTEKKYPGQKNDINDIERIQKDSNASPTNSNSNSPFKEDKNLSIPISKELRLAKRRYYTPKNSATEIQKRTGSCRPQGRPFSGKLAGNFVMHKGIKALIGNLFNKDSIKCFSLQDLKIIDESLDFNIYQESIRCFSDSDHETSSGSKKIAQSKITKQLTLQSNNDVEKSICDSFNCSQFKFVQVMRNSEGKILKVETKWFDKNQSDHGTIIDYKWVKQNVIYPRYKANMKINLIKIDINTHGQQDFVIYTDLKMLIMDLRTKPNKEHFFFDYKVFLIFDSKFIINSIRPAAHSAKDIKVQPEDDQTQRDKAMIIEVLKSEFIKHESLC